MSRLYNPLHSDEVIKQRFEPYTKLDGVYLDKKVMICNFLNRLIIEFDLESSFEANEAHRLKSYLRNNNFTSDGDGTYSRQIK